MSIETDQLDWLSGGGEGRRGNLPGWGREDYRQDRSKSLRNELVADRLRSHPEVLCAYVANRWIPRRRSWRKWSRSGKVWAERIRCWRSWALWEARWRLRGCCQVEHKSSKLTVNDEHPAQDFRIIGFVELDVLHGYIQSCTERKMSTGFIQDWDGSDAMASFILGLWVMCCMPNSSRSIIMVDWNTSVGGSLWRSRLVLTE